LLQQLVCRCSKHSSTEDKDGEIARGGYPSKEISMNSHCPKNRTFQDFEKHIFFTNQFVEVARIPPQRKRK